MRDNKLSKVTDNSRVYKLAKRQTLRCSICPPGKGCNATRNQRRHVRYGRQKPKYKNIKRESIRERV